MFGPMLMILIWAAAAAVFLTLCIVFWTVGKRRRDWLPLKLTLGVALCFFLLLGGWYGLGFVAGYVFYDNFGFAPTRDVTELEGYRFSALGHGTAYLRFRASPETVRRIVGAKYVEIPREEFGRWMEARESPPRWWQPLAGNPTRFYQGHHLDNGYAVLSTAIVSYDEEAGVVHFKWLGLD
jgi:hypothetical protein